MSCLEEMAPDSARSAARTTPGRVTGESWGSISAGAESGGELAGEDGGYAAGILGELGGGLEGVGEGAGGGEGGGILRGEAVVGDHAGAACFGELGERLEDLGLPLGADDERREVGLGKVAVVVGGFLGAHGEGAAFGVVPEARLLGDASAFFEDADLPLDLVLQCGADVAEAVDVFDFGLGAELLRPLEHDGDVGVAAEGAFFHVAVGDAGVEEDLLEAGEVFEGFVGRAEVGLGDDLDEGCAAAVEVDVGAGGGVGEAVVDAFAGVFFEVEAGDADGLQNRVAGDVEGGDGDGPVLGDGLVELRDLVALGGVGVEVVFAGEDAGFADLAADGAGGENGELDGTAVEDGKGAGEAEAGGADVGVGLSAVAVEAAAEGLGLG